MEKKAAKRAIFVWNKAHDKYLLREVLVAEPYKHKACTTARGTAWNQIAERLNGIPEVGFKVSQRAVRERFDKLMREFISKEANEKRASGIEAEYDEIDQALLDIRERMEDAEQTLNCRKEKEEKERSAAEEMRKRATERLKETKKRKENQENDDGEGSQNKRAKKNDIVNLMKDMLDKKKTDQDKEREIREKEIQTQQQMLLQQEQFQQQLLENHNQLQQQQQAVNIAMLNAIGELVKSINK